MRIKKINNRISVKRISLLGLFLAITFTAKITFGFVPGIEIVSFLFIMFGIFLPLLDLLLLITCFNLLVAIFYGFGTWWIVY